MSKHTPGPWRVDANLIRAPGVVWVAEMASDNGLAVREANARLVAAAPDLLVACEDFREFLLAGLSVAQAEHARGNPGAAGVKEVLNGRLALVEAAIEKATKGVVG